MRIALAACIALTFACKDQPAPPPAAATRTAEAPAAANTISGKVQETIDASQYTYLRLQTASGEVWAAVPTAKAAVGSEVTVQNPIWMENFKSATLNRTWPRIAFGTLTDGAAAAEASQGAPGVAKSGAGMSATQAADTKAPAALPPGHPSPSAMPGSHPPPAAAADLGTIKVAKAAGPDGRTVADIYGKRAQLKDKKVSVRGKVVKATNGVMGKNWLHLRDGTGEGATGDLTVASATDTANVGDTVLVAGTVHLDRDLGAGYHYDVLVEDAKIKKE